jgi:hypothetical protein
MPSQVADWFLTRDSRLCGWDRVYIRENGLGRIPRCLALDEWIESIAMFAPSLQQNDAVGAVLVRMLAQESPPLVGDEEPHTADLIQIGQQAEAMRLHAHDAARVAADRALLRKLSLLESPKLKVDAIQAALVALKETQIEALTGEVDDLGETVEALARPMKDLLMRRIAFAENSPKGFKGSNRGRKMPS